MAIRIPIAAACFLAGCLLTASAGAAEVIAEWVGPGFAPNFGPWETPFYWSTDPEYPNNGSPEGTTYDVRIAPALPAQVSINRDVTVNSLTIGRGSELFHTSFDVRLRIVDTLHVADGGLVRLGELLEGGTLTTAGAGRVEYTGGGLRGGLRDVVVDGLVHNDHSELPFLGGTRLGPRGVVRLGDGADLVVPTTGLLGDGQVVFEPGSGSRTSLRTIGEETLRIGPRITVSTFGNGGGTVGGMQFVNDGRLLAETPDGTLFLYGGPFTNRGTVSVANGGSLEIQGAWTNTGVISVDHGSVTLHQLPDATARGEFRVRDGTLHIYAPTTPAVVRAMDVTGTLLSASVLDNTGNVLPVRDGTNTWQVRHGRVLGGSVAAAPGVPLATSGTSELRDVAVEADIEVAPGGTLYLTGTTRVTGRDVRLGSILQHPTRSDTELVLSNLQPLGPGARVVFDGSGVSSIRREDRGPITVPAGAAIVTGTGEGSITGPSVTNAGRIASVTRGKTLTLNTRTVTNQGVLEATGGDLYAPGSGLLPVALTNSGTVRLGVGGDLRVVGSITQSAGARVDVVLGGSDAEQLGQAHATGRVNFAGTLGVEAADGHTILPGQSFEVVMYGSRAGAFDTIANNTPLRGLTFTPVYDADSLTLVSGALTGDADLDGRVTVTDLLAVRRHLGQEDRDWMAGDFDGNGRVSPIDVLLLRRNYGAALSGAAPLALGDTEWAALYAAAVPEPAAPALLFMATALLARRQPAGRKRGR